MNRVMPAWILAVASTVPAVAAQDAVLRTVFARYDSDKNGSVVRKEFPGSDAQFKAMDRDKNGKISFEEYKSSAAARRLLAARNREASEARPRADQDERRARQLRQLARFDPNRDGRITRDEWKGAPSAFADLDVDRSGVIDRKDKQIAMRAADAKKKGTYDELAPQFKTYLPSPEEIFKRHDKNKDQLLTKAEVAGEKFAVLFRLADRNADSKLDTDEVGAMCRQVAARVTQRNIGYQQARAYPIPFSTWDRNNDGRIELNEWREYKQLFPRVDQDRNGSVTKEEAARYKRSVEGRNFVEKFDLNGDGSVTAREFGGPLDAFRRADRNGDGVVSGADR